MDFNPNANRYRFVLGEIRFHACIHHPFQYFLGHA
jgi:hypothetical protein